MQEDRGARLWLKSQDFTDLAANIRVPSNPAPEVLNDVRRSPYFACPKQTTSPVAVDM